MYSLNSVTEHWLSGDNLLDYIDLLLSKYEYNDVLISNGYYLVTSKLALENQYVTDVSKKFQYFTMKNRNKLSKKTLCDVNKWIVVVNDSNVHWWCMIVYLKESKIYVFDSLFDIDSENLNLTEEHKTKTDLLIQCIEKHAEINDMTHLYNKRWSIGICPMFKKQTDRNNCGVFVLNIIELNLKYPEDFIYNINIIDVNKERNYVNHICENRMYKYVDINKRMNIVYSKFHKSLLPLYDALNYTIMS
jgi:hypothetical protein